MPEVPSLVVADNAKYHRSRATPRFIDEQDGQIQLVYLPPNTREVNREQQVWNHAKRELGNRAILCRPALERAVFSILRSLQKQKDWVRSFFQLPDTRYSRDALR